MRRLHLRTRVLLLTGAFTLALFGVTFGISWRARQVAEHLTQLISVETRAVATLEELIRAQNAFRVRFAGGATVQGRYRAVAQLLDDESLASIDTRALRGRVRSFRTIIAETAPRPEDVDATSVGVVTEAQQIIATRKAEIALRLPELEHETKTMMTTSLAVAWILALISFAAVQTTLRKVVRPIENLSAAADRIAAGDLAARAP